MDLTPIFYPQRVCLVGSWKIREEIGMCKPEVTRNIHENLRQFKGAYRFVEYEHLTDVLEELRNFDLAVVNLPPPETIDALRKLVEVGVRSSIIINGGFSERQREEIRSLCRETGHVAMGPNTIMGVINTDNNLNTTFEPQFMPPRGNISVISQSGGVGAALIDTAIARGVGIAKFVFIGDAAVVSEIDVLEFLGRDEQTKVIAMYLETARGGRRLLEKIRWLSEECGKPVVVLKGGRIEESARRALSHTASLALSSERGYLVIDAGLRQYGAVLADSIRDLFVKSVALLKQPPSRGPRVAIVSNVGGPAIVAADTCVRYGLRLAQFSEETVRKIKQRYPKLDVINPLDMIADAKRERYNYVLECVLSDENVDAVLLIAQSRSCLTEPEDLADVPGIAARFGKPIVLWCGGSGDYEKYAQALKDTNLPVYEDVEDAVRALCALYERGRRLKA